MNDDLNEAMGCLAVLVFAAAYVALCVAVGIFLGAGWAVLAIAAGLAAFGIAALRQYVRRD